MPTQIVKRDGTTVPFITEKIYDALVKCFLSLDRLLETVDIDSLVERGINVIAVKYADEIPTVEQVQDIVVFVLQSAGEYDAAEHYIIYRHEHAKQREAEFIPQKIREAFKVDEQYFPTQLQRFQFYDKYSKFTDTLGRRETWPETVRRTRLFLEELTEQSGKLLSETELARLDDLLDEVEDAILNMKVMPSMRLMAMAGEAARRDNSVIYNCAYLPIDSIDSFCELMLNTMAGCGVGYSVEFENVDKIHKVVQQDLSLSDSVRIQGYVVQDSAEGWADALRYGLECWIEMGTDVEFDFSLLRPKGSVLKTKGGRASGPEPLRELLSFIRDRILARQGKKLTTLDCHDIACAIGKSVVSGGVRRTALISLFDEDDQDMLHCKDGDFDKENDQRWCANNSAVWRNVKEMTQHDFVARMWNTVQSERGEPGVFSREVALETMPSVRAMLTKASNIQMGSNPCGEIVLRPWQFCNLTDIVGRAGDTLQDLLEKVRIATIIGTIQSCATYFPNLRPDWSKNCKEERLLGVGFTGQFDLGVIPDEWYTKMQILAIEVNKGIAKFLGINESASITCVKPGGNSAVLLNCSSGVHPRWAKYYIRNVRVTASSAIARILREAGVKLRPENNDDPINPRTLVVSFPVKSPNEAITRHDISTVEHCEKWLQNKRYWTQHNPSVTIYYKPNEVLDLFVWMYEHRTEIGGLTVLPVSEAKYDQLPYIEIDEDTYNEMMAEMPTNIPFERLYLYEKEDYSQASSLPACEAPVCELPNRLLM